MGEIETLEEEVKKFRDGFENQKALTQKHEEEKHLVEKDFANLTAEVQILSDSHDDQHRKLKVRKQDSIKDFKWQQHAMQKMNEQEEKLGEANKEVRRLKGIMEDLTSGLKVEMEALGALKKTFARMPTGEGGPASPERSVYLLQDLKQSSQPTDVFGLTTSPISTLTPRVARIPSPKPRSIRPMSLFLTRRNTTGTSTFSPLTPSTEHAPHLALAPSQASSSGTTSDGSLTENEITFSMVARLPKVGRAHPADYEFGEEGKKAWVWPNLARGLSTKGVRRSLGEKM